MTPLRFKAYDNIEKRVLHPEELRDRNVFIECSSGIVEIFSLMPNLSTTTGAQIRYMPLQYTGLKDSQGTDIYEADIIQHAIAGVFSISWDTKQARYVAVNKRGALLPIEALHKEGSIVGNTYEDASLME